MGSYTKGKWFACCKSAKPHFLFANNGETTICGFHQSQDDGTDLPLEEVQANAKLIEKAPLLLEMLQELVNQIETFTKGSIGEMEYFETEIKQAKQLINSATK